MFAYFEHILAPNSIRDFFEKFHEKDILHIQRDDEGYYNNILSIKELSAFLDRLDIFYPSIRMVKTGKELPTKDYTLKATPIGHHKKDGIIDTEKMFHLFNEGATIVVQAGQRYFEHLSACCIALSKVFNSPIQANLYITPTRSQGFNPHWDTHDVFVVQLTGSKTWHLYGFEKELPTKNHAFISKGYSKTPIKTIQVKAGDFLYVPRGYVHDAVADDGISSHITIGVLSFTWARFFMELLPQIENEKTFREAIPFWKDNLNTVIQEKVEEFKKVLGKFDYQQPLERLNKQYLSRQPQPVNNYFESLLQINEPLSAKTYALNETILYTLTDLGDAGSELSFLNKKMKISIANKSILKTILDKKTFNLDDLQDSEKAIPFIKTLIKEGFVYIQS